jgi:signal peptidase I
MIKRLVFLLLIAVAGTVLLRTFVVEGIYVASASMEPTLHVGTDFFLDKLTPHFTRIKRGDIVVFPSPVEPGKDLIKRVIGVGGDNLEIKNKEVFLQGVKLEESYVKYTRSSEILAGDNLGPLAVPDGTVFVMGDNRDESGDSRDWKNKETGQHIYFVPCDKVKGRIILLY